MDKILTNLIKRSEVIIFFIFIIGAEKCILTVELTVFVETDYWESISTWRRYQQYRLVNVFYSFKRACYSSSYILTDVVRANLLM